MFYSSPGLQLFVYYKESNTLLLTRWSWWCPGHWNCGILPISNSKCCCVHLLWRKFSNLNKRVQVVSLVFGHLPRKGQPKGSPECKWKLTSSEHVTHANIHNYSCWEVFWTLPPPAIIYLSSLNANIWNFESWKMLVLLPEGLCIRGVMRRLFCDR